MDEPEGRPEPVGRGSSRTGRATLWGRTTTGGCCCANCRQRCPQDNAGHKWSEKWTLRRTQQGEDALSFVRMMTDLSVIYSDSVSEGPDWAVRCKCVASAGAPSARFALLLPGPLLWCAKLWLLPASNQAPFVKVDRRSTLQRRPNLGPTLRPSLFAVRQISRPKSTRSAIHVHRAHERSQDALVPSPLGLCLSAHHPTLITENL